MREALAPYAPPPGSNGWVVAPLFPALVALIWLLPRGHQRPAWPAVLLALASALMGWIAWFEPSGSSLHDLLFSAFSLITIGAGVEMLRQTNPVYAALWFAVVILGTCGLFLLLAAPFLAAATIIVYAGAIIVTFLFVIMLAQQSGHASYDRQSQSPIAACLAAFVVLGTLLFCFEKTFASSRRQQELENRLESLDWAVQEIDRVETTLKSLNGTSSVESPLRDVLGRHASLLAKDADRNNALEQVQGALGEWDKAVVDARLTARLANLRKVVDDFRRQSHQEVQQGLLRRPARPGQAVTGDNYDPAEVAGLGVSLFGQYLWGVEMAGSLLMVAVIGAIAIAPQRAGTPTATRPPGARG